MCVVNCGMCVCCDVALCQYFEEYRSLSPWGAVFFGVGVTMTLCGNDMSLCVQQGK